MSTASTAAAITPAMFLPAFPTIRPEALIQPRARGLKEHFPFSEPSARYVYFARNAIWHTVKTLGLEGREVLVPAYHHGVEIEALLDAGALVRFYRIGAHCEVDLDDVAAKIGPQTRALYITHFLGFPGPVRAMKDLAMKHGLPLIEDCALSLFSADGDLPLGTTGDVAVFCLYKVLAVPDGGVLIYNEGARRSVSRSRDPFPLKAPPFASNLAVAAASMLRNVALRGGSAGRKLRSLSLRLGKSALSASKVDPVLSGTQHFNRDHAALGVSRLTQLLLRVQDIPSVVSRRRRNYLFLLERLGDLSAPLFAGLPKGVVPLCYPLLVDDNERVMAQLVRRGIEAVDFWREGHPLCDVAEFPEVATLRRSVLEIPCHQDLTLSMLADMVGVIREVVGATQWSDIVDREAFGAIEGEWNSLLETNDPEPFYRHEYISSFLHNFLPDAALHVVAGRNASGGLVAALPLVSTRGSVLGIPTRELASPSNVHSLRFDLIGGRSQALSSGLLSHLVADTSWDVLKITDVPEGGKAWGLYDAARLAGFPAGAWESQRSPYLTLPRSAELLMKGLRARFRGNLRRRWKRLAEEGEFEITRVAGADLTESALRDCFALERRGWKGRQGSAVNQSESSLGFHIELLRSPQHRDCLSLHQLKVKGETIAFHYGLTAEGVYSLVMTSYDERFKESSPGHLLTEAVLRDCILRGLHEFDFLGCDLPWKLEWTKTVRPHHWIFIFRKNAFGRLLWRIKFVWAKAARRLLTSWGSRSAAGQASPAHPA